MSNRRNPITLFLLPAALILGMALTAACSDDSKSPADSGTKDMAAKDTGGAVDNSSSVDKSKPDAKAPDSIKPDTKVTPDAPPTSAYWKTEYASLPSALNAIAGTSASDVYAVGDKGLILHYDGSAWTSMTNPDTGLADLNSLLIHSASTLYAFGSQMYLKYSGTAWDKGYSSTSYYYYGFEDAWGKASDYIYGVGEMSSGSYYYMSYKSPSSSGYFSTISFSSSTALKGYAYGIWGASTGNEVIVVGDDGLIMHCTSTSCTSSSYWTAMTSGTTSHLRDVYGFSASDVWAAGYNGTVLQYDGTKWKSHSLGTYTYFHGIWGTSSKDIYVVGHPIFKSDESIWHYDGTTWTKMSPPGTEYCNAVWGSNAKNVWVACKTRILRLK